MFPLQSDLKGCLYSKRVAKHTATAPLSRCSNKQQALKAHRHTVPPQGKLMRRRAATQYFTTSHVPLAREREAAWPACLCPAGLGCNRNSFHSLPISWGLQNCKEDKLTPLPTVCYEHNILFSLAAYFGKKNIWFILSQWPKHGKKIWHNLATGCFQLS